MCRVLRVHFSGFYAWLKEPLSHRAQEDGRQTELIRRAWIESGKVYGYPLPGRASRSNVPKGASSQTTYAIRVNASLRTEWPAWHR